MKRGDLSCTKSAFGATWKVRGTVTVLFPKKKK
jgi:hypothetical protein